MGRLVKYCSSCDEGFAERFVFCPTCGASLQAFEMKPVDAEVVVPEIAAAVPGPEQSPVPEFAETLVEEPTAIENSILEVPIVQETFRVAETTDESLVRDEPVVADDVPVTVAVPAAERMFVHEPLDADSPRSMTVTPGNLDDGYYVTVIEEKNVKQRNMLLLGSAVFCVSVALAATVISLFEKDLGVGAIDGDKLFSAVIVDEPMTVEEEQIKNQKDKGGGGGGGGKEEPEPVNQGDLVNQTKNPIRPPDVKVPRLENPSLELPPASTQGDRKFEKNYDRWGDPNSKFTGLSNGPGTGGGIGTGAGTGQGSGRGTGTGSGSGSGSGGGTGDGDGDGDGPGGRGGPPPPVTAVTTPYKILSRPKATYTDAARTNNVQGSVRLKVTLLASGQIGTITPVTRLPHGLTEQAIAAARQIRFEPKKVNGVSQSVVVTIDYGFNIY